MELGLNSNMTCSNVPSELTNAVQNNTAGIRKCITLSVMLWHSLQYSAVNLNNVAFLLKFSILANTCFWSAFIESDMLKGKSKIQQKNYV